MERASQYRKQKLIERYGADMRLLDLREEIAQCEHRGMHDACNLHFAPQIGSLEGAISVLVLA